MLSGVAQRESRIFTYEKIWRMLCAQFGVRGRRTKRDHDLPSIFWPLFQSIIYLMLLVAFIALTHSETREILLSPTHDQFDFSNPSYKTVFILLASYSSFLLSCLLSFFIFFWLALNLWMVNFYFCHGHFNTTCLCSLVILDRLTLFWRGISWNPLSFIFHATLRTESSF